MQVDLTMARKGDRVRFRDGVCDEIVRVDNGTADGWVFIQFKLYPCRSYTFAGGYQQTGSDWRDIVELIKPPSAAVTIDLSQARKGDTVRFRCGGETVIRAVSLVTHDTINLNFAGNCSEDCAWFHDGKFGYAGEHPLDIVEIVTGGETPKAGNLPADEDFWSRSALWMHCFEEARQIVDGNTADKCQVADEVFKRAIAAASAPVEVSR